VKYQNVVNGGLTGKPKTSSVIHFRGRVRKAERVTWKTTKELANIRKREQRGGWAGEG